MARAAVTRVTQGQNRTFRNVRTVEGECNRPLDGGRQTAVRRALCLDGVAAGLHDATP